AESTDAAGREMGGGVRLGREVAIIGGTGRPSRMAAPLLLGTRLLGAIAATRAVDRPAFAADDGEILAAIAERMALDLERERAVELARSEREAIAANKAKSAFLAHISHEIRTPLNAIIGYSELLEEEFLDVGDDGHVADVVRIQGAAKHILALINDMLDLSKIEAGKMELDLEPFAIMEMVDEVVSTGRALVERGGNELEVAVATSLGTMVADRRKTAQVLLNLLSNAGKFTQRGRVVLRVGRELDGRGEWVTFRVEDTGVGMNEAQLGRLFDAYAQVGDGSQRVGGTGLGLALSRHLCELMGGTIGVRSEVGVGSTFTVRLPARVGGERPAAAPR
ncbi:MAG TPA: ATP-binding protein, partial [Nannocystaceae bacterium]|nr:ATP-binding protein [Nannocystaceae bacterium]